MSRRVIVIGSGIAGLAAAYASRVARANVTMVLGRPGASALMSGALDDIEWERASAAPPRPLEPHEAGFLEALGIWEVGAERALVATLSGRLRPARGRDRAILDLSTLSNAKIALPRTSRPGWDADALAASLSAEPSAKERGLVFEAIDADTLRFTDEAALSDWDLALRHDEERMAWLAERLRASAELADKQAVLFGPWLGLEARALEVLRAGLEIPVGEALSPVGGVAGLRFERARDALLASVDVVTQPGEVVRVRGESGRAFVELVSDAMLDAHIVILATGGVAGGGIVLSRSSLHGLDDDAAEREPIFVPSMEVSATVASDGRPLSLASSAHGPDLEPLAWSNSRGRSMIERVGLFAMEDGRARRPDGAPIDWLLVAGDTLSDRPRTALEALRTGLIAGHRAAL